MYKDKSDTIASVKGLKSTVVNRTQQSRIKRSLEITIKLKQRFETNILIYLHLFQTNFTFFNNKNKFILHRLNHRFILIFSKF